MSNSNDEVSIGGKYLYRKGCIIGHGSFAIVFKGRSKESSDGVGGKAVAVKCINQKNLSKTYSLLQKEIKILKELKHENIVQLYDCYQDKSGIQLVMEFCNGGDLGDYLYKKKILSEFVIRLFLRQIAAALKLLTDKSIVHRDLKPQNILLSYPSHVKSPQPDEIRVKVADFGFARYLEVDSMAATLCGSPMYMAPEVMTSQTYDSRADIWSLAVIIYQCLVGKAPFYAQNPQKLRALYENTPILKPNIPEQTSSSLRSLLLMMLKKDMKERCTFREFFAHPFLCNDTNSSQIPLKNTPRRHEGASYNPSSLGVSPQIYSKTAPSNGQDIHPNYSCGTPPKAFYNFLAGGGHSPSFPENIAAFVNNTKNESFIEGISEGESIVGDSSEEQQRSDQIVCHDDDLNSSSPHNMSDTITSDCDTPEGFVMVPKNIDEFGDVICNRNFSLENDRCNSSNSNQRIKEKDVNRLQNKRFSTVPTHIGGSGALGRPNSSVSPIDRHRIITESQGVKFIVGSPPHSPLQPSPSPSVTSNNSNTAAVPGGGKVASPIFTNRQQHHQTPPPSSLSCAKQLFYPCSSSDPRSSNQLPPQSITNNTNNVNTRGALPTGIGSSNPNAICTGTSGNGQKVNWKAFLGTNTNTTFNMDEYANNCGNNSRKDDANCAINDTNNSAINAGMSRALTFPQLNFFNAAAADTPQQPNEESSSPNQANSKQQQQQCITTSPTGAVVSATNKSLFPTKLSHLTTGELAFREMKIQTEPNLFTLTSNDLNYFQGSGGGGPPSNFGHATHPGTSGKQLQPRLWSQGFNFVPTNHNQQQLANTCAPCTSAVATTRQQQPQSFPYYRPNFDVASPPTAALTRHERAVSTPNFTLAIQNSNTPHTVELPPPCSPIQSSPMRKLSCELLQIAYSPSPPLNKPVIQPYSRSSSMRRTYSENDGGSAAINGAFNISNNFISCQQQPCFNIHEQLCDSNSDLAVNEAPVTVFSVSPSNRRRLSCISAGESDSIQTVDDAAAGGFSLSNSSESILILSEKERELAENMTLALSISQCLFNFAVVNCSNQNQLASSEHQSLCGILVDTASEYLKDRNWDADLDFPLEINNVTEQIMFLLRSLEVIKNCAESVKETQQEMDDISDKTKVILRQVHDTFANTLCTIQKLCKDHPEYSNLSLSTDQLRNCANAMIYAQALQSCREAALDEQSHCWQRAYSNYRNAQLLLSCLLLDTAIDRDRLFITRVFQMVQFRLRCCSRQIRINKQP